MTSWLPENQHVRVEQFPNVGLPANGPAPILAYTVPRRSRPEEDAMRNARRWFVCGAAGFMLLSPTGARTEAAQTVKQAPAPRIASVEGVDSYKAYCAVCHG